MYSPRTDDPLTDSEVRDGNMYMEEVEGGREARGILRMLHVGPPVDFGLFNLTTTGNGLII